MVSPEKIMAYCAVVTLVGGAAVTLVAWFLHLKDRAQQIEIERLHDLIDAKEEAMKKELAQRDKEMDRLNANDKACWLIVDRLKDDRNQYWTREEHDKWRVEVKKELKDDIRDMGDRLSEKLEQVSDRFSERIAGILKNCVKCGSKE